MLDLWSVADEFVCVVTAGELGELDVAMWHKPEPLSPGAKWLKDRGEETFSNDIDPLWKLSDRWREKRKQLAYEQWYRDDKKRKSQLAWRTANAERINQRRRARYDKKRIAKYETDEERKQARQRQLAAYRERNRETINAKRREQYAKAKEMATETERQ